MAISIFDRLNASFTGTEDNISQTVQKLRSMPFEQYFGEMDLDDDEKKLRQDTARKLELVLLFIFAYIRALGESAAQYRPYIIGTFQVEFRSAVEQFAPVDDYLEKYIRDITEKITDTTLRHLNDGMLEENYYLSDDRGMYVAEEESNSIHNYRRYREAKERSNTRKRWKTMKDQKVRPTHREVDDKVIGIDDLFTVGETQMRFPRDYEYAGDFPEEIAGCRCSVEYLGDDGKTVDGGGESGILESDKVNIPKEKITQFFLKPGAKHANEFFSAGYTENDYAKLYNDIVNGYDEDKMVDVREKDGMEDYSIFMYLGVTEKKRFRTVWRKDTKDSKPRIITGHRED